MGTSVGTPAPRDMYQEGRDTLQAQVDLAPDIYKARAQYDPQYAQLSVETLRTALLGDGKSPGLLDTYQQIEPKLTEFAAAAQSGQRARDVADVEALGSRATTALRNADPVAAALEDKLAKAANDQLDAGAGLDPALASSVSQGVRAAQAARGFGTGGSDVDVEGLFLGERANAMRTQRQAFAQSVAGSRRASTADPFLAVLGRPSTAAGMASGIVGQGGGLSGNGQSFDPWNSYSADLNNTNFNAKAAAKIAQANNDTALTAAGISAAGSMASSL